MYCESILLSGVSHAVSKPVALPQELITLGSVNSPELLNGLQRPINLK
jgi:hypothetical protein